MPIHVVLFCTFLALLIFYALEDIAHVGRLLHLDLQQIARQQAARMDATEEGETEERYDRY